MKATRPARRKAGKTKLSIRHEAFAQLVAKGVSGSEAYRKVYGHTNNADSLGCRLSAKVSSRIDELQALAAKGTVLSLQEKREFLAQVVRTPIGTVDETSPLVQSAEYMTVGKRGRKTLKLKLCDKLKAMELDAKLSGELEEKVSVTVAHLPPADVLEKVRGMSPILTNLCGGPN